MTEGIFLIQKNGELVEMKSQAYDSEALIQQFPAKHPNLMAGNRVDPESPRRQLLVSREMMVPDMEEGAARRAADHLFLDALSQRPAVT